MKRLMLSATALAIVLGLGACDRFFRADHDRTTTSTPSATTPSGVAGSAGPAGTAGPAGSAATTTQRETGTGASGSMPSTSSDTTMDSTKKEKR
jgi:hypothetical protein